MDRRTLTAIVLSFVLLTAFQFYMAWKYPPAELTGEQVQSGESSAPAPLASTAPVADALPPPVEGMAGSAPQQAMSQPLINTDAKSLLHFKNDLVEGSLSLQGGRLVGMDFLQHTDVLGGKPISFMGISQVESFYQESGFLPVAGSAIKAPDANTQWQLIGKESLQGAGEFKLVWDNGEGIVFEKLFSFAQGSYLFKVEDRLINNSAAALGVYHYSQFKRIPVINSQSMLAMSDFQGPMAYLNGERYQHSYEDLTAQDLREKGHGGWTGFSDKYFLAAMVAKPLPPEAQPRRYYFDYDRPNYRVGMVENSVIIPAGQSLAVDYDLFIGPKEISTLERSNLSLERSIDYGWFHFLAEPLVKVLNFFNSVVHNYGVAIILLTLAIKLLFFPLANKSYRSMNAMKKLQPKIEELKKLHGSDRNKMNEAMMKLYQTHKVNPLGGCLPILVQIPVFFALYKVLFLSVEMRHAPFMLWIPDLSAMDPFYVLPLLMGGSMFLQSKLNPTPSDPMQAKIMMFLPVIFTVMFLSFPSGLVLYWLVNNVLSISQQYYIMKKMEHEPS
ncbi:protein translocase subunit yidC [Magnetococcus marinus MC-1]|uniref:Membrane protein insertase YidC n=1 Tax=Magnetococcus marinus (strain ATCC BAA-1437 / JCM 17883 / MC-1) TaxID=156889 RepID=YIDC_MAGMM|nr:membrane protein insertase YidC [Magnetococcus marinus]A0LE49.1 RecName: Full=Membrane protein insertase YidC; AltName: Full=Foldase YidC; AltName: Full=Membrane integrase YidC; AltName: Full=Membrane protein YidC [Magnetococcus marinus MC-1]ABK46242.1 protein translocase subunit yidC [Magnetococcus marinus MC-1]